MQYTVALLALASTTFAIPQSSGDASDDNPTDDYLGAICLPYNATGYPNFDAPCFALSAIEDECTYGPRNVTELPSDYGGGSDTRRRRALHRRQYDVSDPPTLSNATQRDCLCESQFWQEASGCVDCFSAHGGGEEYVPGFGNGLLASLSSSYCAATNTPTAGFTDVFQSVISSYSATASATPSSSTFSDPIGNRTQVSLYYTAKVTGSAALSVGLQGTGTAATLPAASTVDGQIVATASQNNAAAPSTTTGTAASTHTGAAVRTEAAIAGVVGFAGLLALL